VRSDGAADAGVLEVGQPVVVLSEVAPGSAYGVVTSHNPDKIIAQAHSANPQIKLTASERRTNLELPPALRKPDSRIHRYARQILKDAPKGENNFRRALRLAWAIQDGAIYTLRPPQIPDKVDAAEYFLFESRRGYCTYFAGAMTVLCRAAGIPARVVSGFVNPEWGDNGQSGILREANAHAWTEVWVDGWGWAVVDATPSAARGDNAPDWWENWTDLFGASIDNGKHWIASHKFVLAWLGLALIPILLLVASRIGWLDPLFARMQKWTQGRVKLNQDQSKRLIFKTYNRASRRLSRRFRRRTHWETPDEWLAAAEAALDLENVEPLRELTRMQVRAQYSPHAITPEDGAYVLEQLRALSWKRRNAPKPVLVVRPQTAQRS
jgi:hypothetical protein